MYKHFHSYNGSNVISNFFNGERATPPIFIFNSTYLLYKINVLLLDIGKSFSQSMCMVLK